MTGRSAGLTSPNTLTARARRAFRLSQLEAQGFFGGWLREAWVTRYVSRRGQSFRETWVFDTKLSEHAGIIDAGAVEEKVISRSRFAVPSTDGPVVFSDRQFGAGVPDKTKWVDGALTSAKDLSSDNDPPYRAELPEDLFWELIGLLGGELSEPAVQRLVAAMQDWDYEWQIGYQEVLDRKLFELDSPGNTVGHLDDPESVDGEASLMFRCEIIAKGRDVFAAHIAHPQQGRPGVDGQSSPEFLYVIEEISPYGMPRKSYPIETGSNPAHWPDASPVQGPWSPPPHKVPSANPFSQRVQMETLDLEPPTAGSMYGFVAYAISRTSIREFVGCGMSFTARGIQDEVRPLLQSRLTTGEVLHTKLLVSPQGSGPALGCPLMEVERREGISIAQYVRQYVDPDAG